MKKKQFKSKGSGTALPPAAVGHEVKVPEAKAAPQPGGVVVRHLEFPPPDHLEEEAMKEPSRKVLQDYIGTIRILRNEKGFAFREIAEWLTDKGVEADYNAVYRMYTKGLSEEEEHDVAVRAQEEENERA